MGVTDIIQVFPNFLVGQGIADIRAQIHEVLQRNGVRRDLMLDGTARKMVTVGQSVLQAHAQTTMDLMLSPDLRKFVSGVLGIPVQPYDDADEGCVVMQLEKEGDHQGIHIDSGLFDVHVGLLLEQPHSDDPGGKLVYQTGYSIGSGPLYQTVSLNEGDLYIMKETHKRPHGTLPIGKEGSCRTIIGLGLRTEAMKDICQSPSSKLLFHS